ncbi:MAG: hypothetical protein E6H05_14220 [Bacillati bacterium ANGP1]|uniref:LPXTG cell wall anchor domain-containing protein n=1 Tax=Candidatus Segetimicrobium genomatis TaxID=2569760 RepID=A0A537IFF4_9BACT|nr:MAG: hypothetical protein E6H05_14220 [Terrabacteria group bacterium ANGP1]
MKTRIARFGALAVFALGLAASTGTAIAGNGNGNGNGNAGTPPGQEKKADQTPAAAQPAAPPAASPSAPTSHHGKTSPGQAKQASKASTSTPGVKPSSTTSKSGHGTSCLTGGGTGTSATCTGNGPKPDSSKRYGNGKTAAQIANSHGAPAGTKLTGPGNSQPHKVAVCPRKNNKSGGVDVHAVKSYSTANCAKQQSVVQKTQKPAAANAGTSAAATGGILGASPLTGTAQPAAGGVLGAQATLVKPAKAKAAGGVLGAVTRLGVAGAHATLPFTGLQLWVAVLIALGLIAGGFAVRAGRATAR